MFVPNKQTVTTFYYSQYLLSGQINFTLIHFADQFSHDQLMRYEKLKPRLVWEPEIERGKNVHLKDFPKGSSFAIVLARGLNRLHGVCRH